MQTFTANQAKTRFGELLDLAQKEPVRVTRRERAVGVLVSVTDYEAMRAFYADRVQHNLRRSADTARAQGLTQQGVDALLADES